MSNGGGEKTEQPTPKRLREAREKGQIARSSELVSTAMILALFGYMWINSDFIIARLKEIIIAASVFEGHDFMFEFERIGQSIFELSLHVLAPILIVTVVTAIASNYVQVGSLFSLEVVKPSLSKLNPAKKLKQMFSKKNLFEFAKSLAKVVFLSFLIYLVIKNNLPLLLQLPHCNIDCILPALGHLLKQMMIYAALAFIIVAALDFTFQKLQHIKELKMTKEEVKREYKEMEGSPEIKSRRRSMHHELLSSQVESEVKRSSVIVTNPTRIAVGLYYEEDETALPIVTIKGENLRAEQIIKIAKREGVPIMQNVPLARDLMSNADPYEYIPAELIEPVAEVLRVVRELEK